MLSAYSAVLVSSRSPKCTASFVKSGLAAMDRTRRGGKLPKLRHISTEVARLELQEEELSALLRKIKAGKDCTRRATNIGGLYAGAEILRPDKLGPRYMYTSTEEGASDDYCDPTWQATCDAVAFLSSNRIQVLCYS